MKNIIITAIILCAIVFACQKTESISELGTNGNEISGVPLSSVEVESQLKWIAKGYARLFENSTKRTVLHDYLASKTYNEELHSKSNPYFVTHDTFDFDNLVKNAVDADFPNNNYIQSVYYGFDVDSCFFSTGLRQIDPDLNNLDYRITYVPFDNATQPIDSIWGFYINSTTNDLDSTLLTDDNYDDYDVYVVFVQTNCGAQFSTVLPGCVENGVCEPQMGESVENCRDCRNMNVLPGEHTLEVLSVTIKEDKPMFDESWIENRYELGWNWLIENQGTGLISTNRLGQSISKSTHYNLWKRKEMVRCKNNGTKCKGSATAKGPDFTGNAMYHKFNPIQHGILIHFFESDNPNVYQITPTINGLPISIPSSLSNFFNNFFNVVGDVNNGTFHTVQGPNNNGEGVIYIPAASTWSYQLINGQNFMVITKSTPALSGVEIDIKLGYKI